jgi:hypothetical protein
MRLVSAFVTCLLIIIGSVAGSSPASASEQFVPQRAFSQFAPTDGSVAVYRRTEQPYNWMLRQTFNWDSPPRLYSLRNTDNDAYEHEVNFPGGGCWSGGSYGTIVGLSTNIPNAYLDTNLDDDESVRVSRAAGSYNSSALSIGTDYFYSFDVDPKNCGSNAVSAIESTPLKVAVQDSFRNGSCAAGYAYCVTSHQESPADAVPFSAGWHPRASFSPYYWRLNRLSNESFEGLSGYNVTAASGSPTSPNLAAVYNNKAFDQAYHARFNCGAGTAGCKLTQRMPFSVDSRDLFRQEVAVRCLTAYSSCPSTIAINADGITGIESQKLLVTVPADGYWHIYKLRAGRFNDHDRLEFAVYNRTSSQHLDVDFALMHWSDYS